MGKGGRGVNGGNKVGIKIVDTDSWYDINGLYVGGISIGWEILGIMRNQDKYLKGQS